MKIGDLTLAQCKEICKNFIASHNGYCEEFDGEKTIYRCPLRKVCDFIGEEEYDYELNDSGVFTLNEKLLDIEIEGL